MTGTLVLLRHGSSVSTERGVFTGWLDVALTESGVRQARRAGELLATTGMVPDIVHTSLLARAIDTAHHTLNAAGRHWIDARRSWRLNERHYGALQGREKRAVAAESGRAEYTHWRRSWDGRPPPLPADRPDPATDPRYAGLGPELPRTESLADVHARLLPYWQSAILPDLARGRTVLVVSHSNALRALIKHLDGIGDTAIADVNVPTGCPLVYHFNDRLRVVFPAVYLDPGAAGAAAAAVAAEGLDAEPAGDHAAP